MLEADARGEDTAQQFDDFMANYGDFFPDNPQSLEELIDSLARRAAAAQRLMNSLSPEQQAELAELMQQAMQDSGLAAADGPAVRPAARPPTRARLAGPAADARRHAARARRRDHRA